MRSLLAFTLGAVIIVLVLTAVWLYGESVFAVSHTLSEMQKQPQAPATPQAPIIIIYPVVVNVPQAPVVQVPAVPLPPPRPKVVKPRPHPRKLYKSAPHAEVAHQPLSLLDGLMGNKR